MDTIPVSDDPPVVLDTEVVAVIEPVVRASHGKAFLFDLDAILCPGGKYRTSVPGVGEVRGDGVHFTVDGAMWFADTYGKQLIGIGGK